MRGEQDCRLHRPVDLLEKLTNPVLGHNVEAYGRLVEKHDAGVVQESGGDVATHALAQAQFPHRRVQKLVESQQLAEEAQSLPEVFAGDVVDAPQQFEALDHRDVPPQLRPLTEDHSDRFGVTRPVAVGIEPGGDDLSGRRHEYPGHHLARR